MTPRTSVLPPIALALLLSACGAAEGAGCRFDLHIPDLSLHPLGRRAGDEAGPPGLALTARLVRLVRSFGEETFAVALSARARGADGAAYAGERLFPVPKRWLARGTPADIRRCLMALDQRPGVPRSDPMFPAAPYRRVIGRAAFPPAAPGWRVRPGGGHLESARCRLDPPPGCDKVRFSNPVRVDLTQPRDE